MKKNKSKGAKILKESLPYIIPLLMFVYGILKFEKYDKIDEYYKKTTGTYIKSKQEYEKILDLRKQLNKITINYKVKINEINKKISELDNIKKELYQISDKEEENNFEIQQLYNLIEDIYIKHLKNHHKINKQQLKIIKNEFEIKKLDIKIKLSNFKRKNIRDRYSKKLRGELIKDIKDKIKD